MFTFFNIITGVDSCSDGFSAMEMKPLSVDVHLASSSDATSAFTPRKSGQDSYEVVSYGEVFFPDFRHVKRLGRGAYGTVVECFFRGMPAAAKLVENGNDHVQIRSEAELLHGFKHKNIIRIYALFHGEMSGLVLELMEGGSLSELLHQHKHITYQACHVLHWAHQVCEALSYLHAYSYIHRDIKPSNMLLSRDYKTLKICDFGTVAELKTSMTDNRGTAAWMAPEVFRGRRYDQKCDIFSLGISLWEMVARKQPFTELNETNPVTLLWKVAENGLRPPRIEDLPEPLMDLIERCWLNSPEERPCLEEVKKTVEAFIEIFPNAHLLPLVDRTTAKQALADSSAYSRQAAVATQPVPMPVPPNYYSAQALAIPSINVQRPTSPGHSPSHRGRPQPIHSSQSQVCVFARSNSHHLHPYQPMRHPHPPPIHSSRSLLDLSSSSNSDQQLLNPSQSASSSSSSYHPCLSSPWLPPPQNYPVQPNSISRANSLPPPESVVVVEERPPGKRKGSSSHILKLFRGLKNF